MIRPIAEPWWVNLLILVPLFAYAFWRRGRVPLALRQLTGSGVFSAAFGIVEGIVVVYLRAAAGLLPGSRFSGEFLPSPQDIVPRGLLAFEIVREAATIIMLIGVAFLSADTPKARGAIFLWMFAIWDMLYYATLRATIGWPLSLSDPDVLFLIPVPWYSPVWFPLLVSALAIAAVLLAREARIDPIRGPNDPGRALHFPKD